MNLENERLRVLQKQKNEYKKRLNEIQHFYDFINNNSRDDALAILGELLDEYESKLDWCDDEINKLLKGMI